MKSKNMASDMNMYHLCVMRPGDWLESIMKKALKAPPAVSLITQDGRAQLPRSLLHLAGALDGPAGEPLVEESPVVIAPDVTSAAVTALASTLSSGRLVMPLHLEIKLETEIVFLQNVKYISG